MIDLIRKRHDGPAWIVVEELGNGTGYNVSRHADAVAIGLWPSRGYEIHGYEVKASRGDVRKELDDPSKADAVGKFCDYWWLAVADLKIIDGLVIPETWGILYPKNKVLRVHRKAPKRDATAVNRSFSAALIRKVCSSWIPKYEHDELKKTARDEATKKLMDEQKWKQDSGTRELDDLRKTIERFEERSGVSITQRYGDDNVMSLGSWELDRIAAAVKVVREAREASGESFHGDDAASLVRGELDGIERAIRNHEIAIANRRSAADRVRELLKRIEPVKPTPVQLSLVEDV